jgi:hypothetical protein
VKTERSVQIEEILNDAKLLTEIKEHSNAISNKGSEVYLSKDEISEGHPDLIKGTRATILIPTDPKDPKYVVIEYIDGNGKINTIGINPYSLSPNKLSRTLPEIPEEFKTISTDNIMETKKYKYDKFEHYKNKMFEGLKYVSNFDEKFQKEIRFDLEVFLKPEILSKNSNFYKDPDKFSFTEFKTEISEVIKKVEVPIEKKENKIKILNFIKMVNINQNREFTVFGEKRFDTEIKSEEPKTKYDFDYFKKEISLPDFLRLYGFEIEKKGSTKNCVKLKNEDTGELFLIRKNPTGNYIIWDPLNDVFKGSTIIDFVLEKHKNEFPDRPFTFRDAAKLLTDYIEGKHFVSSHISNYKLEAEIIDVNKISRELNNLKPFKDRAFLHNRGIEDFIIDSPLFKNKIFNHSFVDDTGTEHINTAFPMIGDNGVVAISKRNENFKGMMGEKDNGIFISRDITDGGKIDKIILIESAIDAISHYQINYEELRDKKVRYISTEGEFSENQTDIISKVINKQTPDEVCFGQDNDLEGTHQITKLLSNLKLDEKLLKESKGEIPVIDIKSFKSKTDCWAEITYINEPIKLKEAKDKSDYGALLENERIKEKASEKRSGEINHVLDFFKVANEDLKGISHEEFPFGNSVSVDSKNNQAIVRITFNNHHFNWEKVNQFIIENKFKDYNINLSREKPVTKDFNDDLKAIKGIHPDYKITFDENKNLILRKTKKEITLYSKIKGETDGDFEKIYIGRDQYQQLYKSYNINFNNIKNSNWEPITNEEHNKLSSTLHEEIIEQKQNNKETKTNLEL